MIEDETNPHDIPFHTYGKYNPILSMMKREKHSGYYVTLIISLSK